MKSRKGITLVEIVIAMALLGLVLSSAYSMLFFSNRVHRKGIDEYELQASMRLVSEHTNQISRFSTAVFTIPRSSFREDNLTDGWNYIGILEDSIVKYEYKDVNGVPSHVKTVLVPADPNIEYKLAFSKDASDTLEKNILFTIQAFAKDRTATTDDDGNPIGHFNIASEVESLNALQVIHKGTALNPAVALAFRSEARNRPEFSYEQPVAQIAMVLDTSGSMNWNMQGRDTNNVEERRIRKLQNAAKDLVNKFAAAQHTVSISLVPFATDANNPMAFRNARTETSTLISYIDSLTNWWGEAAGGGTNTGDGLRRAYYRITNGRSAHSGAVIKDYIIILVDGVTTYSTVYNSNRNQYFTGNGNVTSSHYIKGPGNENNAFVNEYVRVIGNMIVADGNIKTYVIGFSSNPDDYGNINQIAEDTGAEKVFTATDYDELNLIFDEIRKNILNELWHIDGPDL